MLRFLVPLLLAACSLDLIGQTVTPDGLGRLVERPGWLLQTIHLSRQSLILTDPADSAREPRWMEALKPMPPVGGLKRLWEARELLASMGINLPEGTVATYDAIDETLTTFLPEKDQREVARLLESCCRGGFAVIHLEFIIAEFELPATATVSGRTLSELEQAAGKSWVIRENTIVANKSGNAAKFEAFGAPRKVEQSGKTPMELVPMQPGERGTQIEVEPTIGPDGLTFDINLAYRRGGRLPGSDNDLDVSISTSIAATHDSGAIVHVWTLPPRKEASPGQLHYAALLVRPSLVTEMGRLEKQIFPR